MIAMSSIISFDIYGTYVNKKPSDAQLIRWSHIGVVVSTLFVSTLATIFHQAGVDMTWLLYMVGILICPGFFPTIFALLWKRQTRPAAIASPIVGIASGLAVWFGTAYHYYGEITITSTGGTMPCLFGVVTSFCVPLPVTVAISLAKPDVFDWAVFGRIAKVRSAHGESVHDREEEGHYFTPERVQYMKRMSRWAAFWAALTVTGHMLLWPLPMYGAKMTFSKPVSCILSHNTWVHPSSPCRGCLLDFLGVWTDARNVCAAFHRLDRYLADLAVVHARGRQFLPAPRRRNSADSDRDPRQEGN